MSNTQADRLAELPPIDEDDRQWLSYNPNTSDIVEWIQRYALASLAKQKASQPSAPQAAVWNRDAAIEMIAAERIAIIRKPEAERTPAETERLAALNADMNALSPRVTQGMVDQLREIHQVREQAALPAGSVELGDRFMEILRAINGPMPDSFTDSARLAFVHAKREALPVDLWAIGEQAEAWLAVVRALDEASPEWQSLTKRGMDSACAAIRALAQRTTPAAGVGEQATGGGFCCEHSWSAAKQLAWKERNANCGCDHNESCLRCFPAEFRAGGRFHTYAPDTKPAQAEPMSDERIKEVILQTVYEGDDTIPFRDHWSANIGIPFARAILAEAGTKEKANG